MPPPKLWISLWIIGTFGGSILGTTLAFCIGPLIKPLTYDQFYLQFIIFGACLGLIQWIAALKSIVNGLAWTLATIVASVLTLAALVYANSHQFIAPILDYYNLGCLSNSCDSYKLHETWFMGTAVIVIIISLSTALPTGIVLLRYSSRIYMWVLGIVIASAAGILAYVAYAVSFRGILADLFYIALLGPLIIAIISAPFAYITLQKPAKLRH